MKPILTIFLCFLFEFIHAQVSEIDIQFDWRDYYTTFGYTPSTIPTHNLSFVQIDTTHRNNKWQIGRPAKQHFTAAYTMPNAIVTDTVAGCTPGDTSVFFLRVPKAAWLELRFFSFAYQLDKDTDDIALFEVSTDTGKNWINMVTDSAFQQWPNTTNFSNSTSGWDSISYGPIIPYTYPDPYHGYFLFRFTFIAGQSARSRDGWMIDDIKFYYLAEGILKINQNISAAITPNPANQSAIIKYSLPQRSDLGVHLFDALGMQVKNVTIKNALSGQTELTTRDLHEGMYFYSVTTAYGQTTGKLVVSH